MSFPDLIQLLGAVFVLAGYWWMARNPTRAGIVLLIGCLLWAYWATLIHPFAIWLFLLEITLAGMSARTFWINHNRRTFS